MPTLQRKADSLEADSAHDNHRLEELQAEYALLEHELQVPPKAMLDVTNSDACDICHILDANARDMAGSVIDFAKNRRHPR